MNYFSYHHLYHGLVNIEYRNLTMSGDYSVDGHPARKVDHTEVKQILAEKREDVPAVTKRVMATEFPDVTPQTVKDNLDALADNEEICRFNDGDIFLYWYPREHENAGDIPYSEVLDDSIEYNEIDPTKVPIKIAEEIATERLPYYRPRSLWSETAGSFQLGIMFSFGLIILSIGELVSGTFGLSENTSAVILQIGFILAVLTTILYTVSVLLDVLAARGYVTRDPISKLRGEDSSERE